MEKESIEVINKICNENNFCIESSKVKKAIQQLLEENKSLIQENSFLKTMYSKTQEFKNFEKYLDNLKGE
jgi:regulator of replication initiation timing